MNRTARVVCSVFVFLFILLISPRPSQATDWQPISPEDLALKDNPKEPGADAMILYRELDDDASKAATSGDTLEEYVRMKIFTQEGTKYGHVEIDFEKSFQDVVYITGRTIKPDGTVIKFDGQVLETTIEKSNGRKILAKTFTLPEVQPGCIIEYKYQLQGNPEWVHGHEWIVSQPTYTREAIFSYRPDTGSYSDLRPMDRIYLLPAGTLPKEQANGTYLLTVHDVPAVVEEPLMPPERPIESRVTFYYQGDGPAATDPSDKYWSHYAKKWDGTLERFIDKKNVLSAEVAKIVSPSDSPEIKLRKIYARAQQIRNLNEEDLKTQKENKSENLKPNANVEDVLSRGYGNSMDIDYLFVGLARAAGFDATEIYIAPRNLELFLPTQNDADQISDEIVWVHAGSQDYYLDPGARYFPFGLLPWYETETGGIKVDKHGGTAVNTPVPASSDATTIRNTDLEVNADGSVVGTLQVDFTGQWGALMRDDNRLEDESGRTKNIGDEIRSWLPAGATFNLAKIANWDNTDQPVHVEGTLTIPSFGSGAGRRMLMPLALFQESQMSAFTKEKRSNAVYFHFPYEEIDDIKLRAPLGYKVESVPPGRNNNLGAVTYEIVATAQGDGVEVKRHLAEKSVIFSKDDYPVLRRFFGSVKANDNSQMVLQNAPSAKSN
jgi:hypothetical protein